MNYIPSFLTALAGAMFLLAVLIAFEKWPFNRKHRGRNTTEVEATLFLKMMIEECDLFLRIYRGLYADYPEETKFPLNYKSWPEFSSGKIWTVAQLRLSCFNSRLDWFVMMLKAGFRLTGWKDSPEIFDMPKDSTRMVDLLESLSRLRIVMLDKVKVLEGR